MNGRLFRELRRRGREGLKQRSGRPKRARPSVAEQQMRLLAEKPARVAAGEQALPQPLPQAGGEP